MKPKLTLEDATMYYNKWVSGLAAREFSAQRTKFKDLFGKGQDVDQSPNNSKAGDVLPYQLTQAASILGDLLTNTSNAIAAFEDAKNNPILTKNKKAKDEVEVIVQHLNASLEELKAIIQKVNEDGR